MPGGGSRRAVCYRGRTMMFFDDPRHRRATQMFAVITAAVFIVGFLALILVAAFGSPI